MTRKEIMPGSYPPWKKGDQGGFAIIRLFSIDIFEGKLFTD